MQGNNVIRNPIRRLYMKKIISITRVCSLVVFMLFASITAKAGEVTAKSDGSVVWQAGIDGVEIEWDADGSFHRIYSLFNQPVQFPDRQGITKAQIIAEEKAKAAIIRFMDQQVATARVVTQVDNDIQQATRTQGTGKQEDITKTNQRTMVENLIEITTSAAAGKLRGVIILERGYNQKEELAWVKVGISKKTIAASRALKDTLSGKPPADTPSGQSNQQGSGITLPGSEVQKSKQKDW
jgi:hypothetical protein